MSLDETIANLSQRSVADRIRIVEELWETIPVTDQWPPLSDDECRELIRRERALADDPTRALTWNDLVSKLRMPMA
jgi:putative addiction module component (TIGR02574 family)